MILTSSGYSGHWEVFTKNKQGDVNNIPLLVCGNGIIYAFDTWPYSSISLFSTIFLTH